MILLKIVSICYNYSFWCFNCWAGASKRGCNEDDDGITIWACDGITLPAWPVVIILATTWWEGRVTEVGPFVTVPLFVHTLWDDEDVEVMVEVVLVAKVICELIIGAVPLCACKEVLTGMTRILCRGRTERGDDAVVAVEVTSVWFEHVEIEGWSTIELPLVAIMYDFPVGAAVNE